MTVVENVNIKPSYEDRFVSFLLLYSTGVNVISSYSTVVCTTRSVIQITPEHQSRDSSGYCTLYLYSTTL